MQYVTDLHLHSRYSRAVSQHMILSTMAEYAVQKGLDILTASDWTHPLWLKEITTQLEEKNDGMYGLKTSIDSSKKIRFLLSTEISSIYKQGEKLRRIHNLVFVPNFETAEKINKELLKRGCNLNADGRPIIGLSSKQLLELILSIDARCMLIPAHIWTPHFGIYGSASGFESLEEAFGELSSQIFGIETGLSSDPDMNWSVRELLDRSILSFSDAHSPAKMGREATVFLPKNPDEKIALNDLSYNDLVLAIKRDEKARIRVGYTIEFYPEEGKYHFSGHRNCHISLDPTEIKKGVTECPVCHRRLTEGVLYRVQQLASENLSTRAREKENKQHLKWYTDTMKKQPPYVKLVQLQQIVAESLGATVASQKTQQLYAKLCNTLVSELEVLLRIPIADIAQIGGDKVAEGIARVRAGNITIIPGFDGEYGKVTIWDEKQAEKPDVPDTSQLTFEL